MLPHRFLIICLFQTALFAGVLGWAPVAAGPLSWGKSAMPAQAYAKTVIEKDFMVSRIGRFGVTETRDKLLMFYELISQKEAKRSALTLKGKVVKSVEDGLYIVSCSGILIAVETSSETVVKDDGSIEMLIKPDGFYGYIHPDGVGQTLRRYKYQKLPEYELTREDFVSRLKHGEVFTVETKEPGVCRLCNGLKYIGSKLDGTSKACSLCNGSGVEEEQPIRYKITWGQ